MKGDLKMTVQEMLDFLREIAEGLDDEDRDKAIEVAEFLASVADAGE